MTAATTTTTAPTAAGSQAAPPRLRRRPAFAALGVALVGFGGLAAAWLAASMDASTPVVVAAHDLYRGEVLAAGLGDPLDEAIADHVLTLDGGVRLLAGVATAAQVPSMAALWEPLARSLRAMHDLGVDVIVDAGRLGAAHGPMPLLRHADLVALLLRSDLPSINAARGAVGMLGDELARTGLGTQVLHTVLVGPGRPYSPREVTSVLRTPMLGDVAWDPRAAAVLSTGAPPGRGASRAALSRSLNALASAAAAALSVAPTTSREHA